MRLALGMLVAAMIPAVTLAQSSGAIVATPLPPPTVLTPAPMPDQAPQEQPPADQTQSVMPPSPNAQPAAPQTTEQAVPQGPAAPSAPQPMQLTWQPQGSAQLQVLDKVNALSTVLNVKVGQQGQYGSLTIQVKACDTHPSDQPQDSAAYLAITDGHADAPGFQGWMLANEPSASMLQNPIYDVRVVGCQA